MDKVDVKKALKHLYQPPAGDAVRVEVPAMHFLMVDGQGDPNTYEMENGDQAADAIEA